MEGIIVVLLFIAPGDVCGSAEGYKRGRQAAGKKMAEHEDLLAVRQG